MERRLVTILAADAAGYSRLVAEDEDAALARFHEHSALMTAHLEECHGRVFGGAGDSLVWELRKPRGGAALRRQDLNTNSLMPTSGWPKNGKCSFASA